MDTSTISTHVANILPLEIIFKILTILSEYLQNPDVEIFLCVYPVIDLSFASAAMTFITSTISSLIRSATESSTEFFVISAKSPKEIGSFPCTID